MARLLFVEGKDDKHAIIQTVHKLREGWPGDKDWFGGFDFRFESDDETSGDVKAIELFFGRSRANPTTVLVSCSMPTTKTTSALRTDGARSPGGSKVAGKSACQIPRTQRACSKTSPTALVSASG